MTADLGFAHFGLDGRLMAAIDTLGFDTPTPIQSEAIPALLKGHDVVGGARTGSGKTAAFGLPLLERVKDGGKSVRALLLTPTRELCLQVTQALRSYSAGLGIKTLAIYGGTPYPPQLKALRSGVTVVVGTPGRVLDLIKRGALDLSSVEVMVLDEADEMLRMGFIDDVDSIIGATPEDRQVALFSATMPREIQRVAAKHLREPLQIQVESSKLSTSHIQQRWMRVPMRHRVDALARVLQTQERATALVFARTRADCAEIADALVGRGIAADALHGDLSQAARERVISRLRSRRLDLVVATDVASRGIDVNHISHVINLELPRDRETYVHRIGRTGRAGRDGLAITFVTPKFRHRVRGLARSLKVDIDEMPVPTDADLAARRRELLRTALEGAHRDEADPVTAWIDELREGTGWTDAQVAAAAVRLLAEDRDVSMAAAAEEGGDSWIRPPGRQEHKVRDDERSNEVEIFLHIGRIGHVRPADLVGALANEAGVPSHEIGRITVVDRKSFVGLPRDVAERLVQEFPVLTIRGVEVRVAIARPRVPWQGRSQQGRGGDRRPHRPGRKHPGKRFGRGDKRYRK